MLFISRCQLLVTSALRKKHKKTPFASAALKSPVKMKSQLLVLLLFLSCKGQSSCPGICSCHGGTVDCSGRSLTASSLPTAFPAETAELRLHDNLLTTLPNALLDSLPRVRSVTLHGNPWACDCGVLYLRAWLLRHTVRHASHLQVNCSSPLDLRGRLVAYLSEEELLDTCRYWYCDLALASQLCLLGFVVLQGALLLSVVVFLRRFQHMSKEARRTKEESFTAGETSRDEYAPLNDTSI
ncbi:platelet glycoprotein Ib beta chain [Eucyclogobius newberryi]|uniref:platelet glycoprotein Ib beta chain n=1 Tax=Eucyclogobius newberryi TaxID=166745 RepID=UPI003B5A0163